MEKKRTVFVFILAFIVMMCCVYLLNQNQEKAEKLNAVYTAEATVGRLESQLNKYLEKSNLIKKMVEGGYDLDNEKFSELSRLIQDDNGVIEAYELAKDGVVSQVYPMEGNEKAVGMDMLKIPARKKEAYRAMESGQYTIAGPYELAQGGTGSLLFDPIYMKDKNGEQQFWGFSILVINWENFIQEIELDKLNEAGYHYQIWKSNMSSKEKTVIAQCQNVFLDNTLQVVCDVPNDTWYFEIVPKGGWISVIQKVVELVLAVLLSVLVTGAYMQIEMQRQKDALHAKELEKMAKEARKASEAKSRFLFNMSHDIRTPMNAIIGFADLLEKHIDDPEKVKDYIEKIKNSSEFLLSLINYVLEMARIESGRTVLKKEVGSSKRLIDSLDAVFQPMAEEQKIRYTCHSAIKHEYAICDETKIREIFINVIGNALKYTPSGGSVRVDITEIPALKKEYISYKIIVEDTGIGMSEEYLPHIFEEFTRERTSTESKVIGTGLGLPIVKSLVDLMGGSIRVESEPGKGTKFTIILSFPKATEEQIRKSRENRRKELTAECAGKSILLAEDNELNAEIAVTLLEDNGLKVDCVKDGLECVERLKQKPEKYYDAILMDIQMPNMDGYEAARTIRKLDDERSKIPIIAMTANAFEEDRQKAFESGMNEHIPKPIDVEVLFEALAQVIK